MDDWNEEADPESGRVVERTAEPRMGPDPAAIETLAQRLSAANNPVLVAGPDIDAAGEHLRPLLQAVHLHEVERSQGCGATGLWPLEPE
jgi:thiamine pyrophosphate-dependent acetolactate synthase large subunit-like protein